MRRLRKKLFRMLVAMLLSAALSGAERYGTQDTWRRDGHFRNCCSGVEGRYSGNKRTILRPVALYIGEEQLVSRYNNTDRQTAAEAVPLNEPLVLFTCGVCTFLAATALKRKLLNKIPSESLSVELSALESLGANAEPINVSRGESWGTGGREVL